MNPADFLEFYVNAPDWPSRYVRLRVCVAGTEWLAPITTDSLRRVLAAADPRSRWTYDASSSKVVSVQMCDE